MRMTVSDTFGQLVPMAVYTDSECLYDALIEINSTSKKRLLTDLTMLRQAYELQEVGEIS